MVRILLLQMWKISNSVVFPGCLASLSKGMRACLMPPDQHADAKKSEPRFSMSDGEGKGNHEPSHIFRSINQFDGSETTVLAYTLHGNQPHPLTRGGAIKPSSIEDSGRQPRESRI